MIIAVLALATAGKHISNIPQLLADRRKQQELIEEERNRDPYIVRDILKMRTREDATKVFQRVTSKVKDHQIVIVLGALFSVWLRYHLKRGNHTGMTTGYSAISEPLKPPNSQPSTELPPYAPPYVSYGDSLEYDSITGNHFF